MRDVVSGPILIADDDGTQSTMLGIFLKQRLGYDSVTAENGRIALDILEKDVNRVIRLAILDLNMPIMDGLEALSIIRQRDPALPVIMLTGSKDVEDAVHAMKLGATDFLNKPYEAQRLLVTVQNALKIGGLSKEVSRLKNEREGLFSFSDLIGSDNGLSGVVRMGRKASASDIPVLVTGETGTGKEVLARAIHGESARCGKSFIALNCGAIPAQLVESTLFGHEKGAFTGATSKMPGKFREASGGTIFLDEIGELPLDSQVKLLRVLQQREVEPVGAAKPVSVDVRVISATNRDLAKDVQAGRFREDLYFRLNVLQIHIPSLSERKEDIPALIYHFIERQCAGKGRPLAGISLEAISMLKEIPWRGNVRELENVLHRALVLSEGGRLEVKDFEPVLRNVKNIPTGLPIESLPLFDGVGNFRSIEALEKEAMHAALAHFGGNTTRAAEALGMAKSTFYRKTKGV
ncbi:MAG: sigma-54 dependent transcriptional regulator [Alphaproteobacteria bacterium]